MLFDKLEILKLLVSVELHDDSKNKDVFDSETFSVSNTEIPSNSDSSFIPC